MKDFFKYCTICIILPIILPIIIASINWVVDYRQFVNFSTPFISKLVKDLESNHLTYHINMPARKINAMRIENNLEGLGINNIIIGSSRVMLVGRETGYNYINLGVSGFTLEDAEHIHQLLKKNEIMIDTLIWGIDPWILNKNHGDDRHLEFNSDYSIAGLRKLFSFEYFWDNITINKYEIWDGDTTAGIKYKDGSIKYGSKYIERWNNADEKILSFTKGSIYHLENFNKIDNRYLLKFDKILTQFQNISNHTILFLMPFHPLVYDKLVKKVPMVLSVENEINMYGKEIEIPIFGSFNPHISHLKYSDFYDAMHLSESGMKKYFKMKVN